MWACLAAVTPGQLLCWARQPLLGQAAPDEFNFTLQFKYNLGWSVPHSAGARSGCESPHEADLSSNAYCDQVTDRVWGSFT